jgi:PEGA domain-containing protein
MRWLVVLAIGAHVAAADTPAGYKCGPGGRVQKDVGCVCPKDKLAQRDADNNAVCVPKPPPTTSACLAEHKGNRAVSITTNPDGATMYIGSKSCGPVAATPWAGSLTPGPMTVIVERASYDAVTREIVVTAQAKQSFSIDLVRTNAGSIDVRADADAHVSGAQVSVDGDARGKAPLVTKAKTGRHTVKIEQAGYQPFTQIVDVYDQQTTTVLPVLVVSTVALGKLVVDADVDGAEVLVDGTSRGMAPVVVDVPVGPHEVEVRKKDLGKSFKQTANVGAGQTLVHATLAQWVKKAPTDGTLVVTSMPPGADVLVEGVHVGKTPYEAPAPAGEYWLAVRAEGYAQFDARVTIVAGQKKEIAATLAKAFAVKIESTPANAAVFVDGKRVGETPMTLTLTAGDHDLFIEKAGYQRYTQKLAVTKVTSLTAILQR